MERQPPLRPTVIGEIAPHGAPQATPGSRKPAPTLMPGVTVTRLAPDPDALRVLAPDAAPETIAAAARLLSLAPSQITPRLALFWGQPLQEAHRDLTAQRVALAQAPALREASAHLARLRDILLRFDPEAMASGGSIGQRLMKHIGRVIDTPAEVTAARDEITLLLRLLAQGQDGLLAHRDRLAEHGAALQDLGDRIEAAALAADWAAQNLPPEHRRSFEDRRMSLRASLVQLRAAQLQLAAEAELPGRLILAVQNIALVALPAWAESLSLLQTRRPSPTEARDIAFRLNAILPLFPRSE